ncbi:MAG TPA: sulfurtransferase TusA family protein [Candidatus Deferrimicrobiaceae bacterium]|jgi:TusA-related sulfurtransferase
MTDVAPSGQVVTLDLRGQVCPASLLLALRKVNELKGPLGAGTVGLDVLTDNRDSVGTISDATFNMGFQVSSEKRDGHYVLAIRSGR